ncbi:MAG: SIS domain-containing protein [Anaerolineaceae bacterium]|nr:SIS domain-containing protein [Anaerolineaceae bacterium]
MALLEEINEQPDAIKRLLDSELDNVRSIIQSIRSYCPDYVFIVARGTSDHAGLYGKYLLGMRNKLPVALAAPSMFTLYKEPPSLKKALVIAISQSGQSPDLISVIEEAVNQGALTLTLSNQTDSPLAKKSQFVMDICAGTERAIAATKSYTNSLIGIALLSGMLNEDDKFIDYLYNLPQVVDMVLNQSEIIQQGVERYRQIDHCVVLSRGFNYATACEWALKLKELTYIVAEPYSAADFRHGPLAILDPGFPVFAIATRGPTLESMYDLLREARHGLGTDLVCISDEEKVLKLGNLGLRIPPDVPEWATPMISIVLGQLFSYHLTVSKGINPDIPRGLNKVTKTE